VVLCPPQRAFGNAICFGLEDARWSQQHQYRVDVDAFPTAYGSQVKRPFMCRSGRSAATSLKSADCAMAAVAKTSLLSGCNFDAWLTHSRQLMTIESPVFGIGILMSIEFTLIEPQRSH
jgi:hypothetical protein